MKKLPISVFIIAKNEEVRIPITLKSIQGWFDEIIVVVDTRTSDKTPEIAESFGAKVIFREWEGFAVQKAFAEDLCKNDWVFNLDADEEVSVELKEKLFDIFGKEELPEEAGFEMKWLTMYPGQEKPSRFAPKDYIMRIYNKKKAKTKVDKYTPVDRATVHTGKVTRLEEVVYHRTILSFAHLEVKNIQYSDESAMSNVEKGKRISAFRFYTDFPLKFLKYYFLRGFCLQGWYGFTLSIMAAYRNFMRLAKTRELYALENAKKSTAK